MRIELSKDLEGYRTFLAVKTLPSFRFIGRVAEFPDCYADRLGIERKAAPSGVYEPIPGLFDYQEFAARLAIEKQKFALFFRPGLGKTLCAFEFMRHARSILGTERRLLMVSPLMVVKQTIREAKKFYSDRGIDFPIEQVSAKNLAAWTQSTGDAIGITNFEALSDDVEQGLLALLVVDESQIMKSAYGKTGQHLLRLGAGLDWKLCLSGTPAPNDRIEYALTSVFLDVFPTVNSFLARYFVNRGQTNERWEIKPHALGPFYRSLSHWCMFLNSPASYGFKSNADTIPPIHVHIHDVDLTPEQKELVGSQLGTLFAGDIGGITTRATLSQIAKGNHKGRKVATNKPQFIHDLIETWNDHESTLVWCRFNEEQKELERALPGSASITGSTPQDKREELIEGFQSGKYRTLISKPVLLGLGLNLQVATRQVFSSAEDSYESYVQAIMRSNRVGSTRDLNVHLPVTDVELPMLQNILRKAKRVDSDMEVQEGLFRSNSGWRFNAVA